MNPLKSAKDQTIDGILFLQDVFKRDCDKLEASWHERLVNDKPQVVKIYDKIPLVFDGLDRWPKTTNLLCWNCNRAVKKRPWFEPQSINPTSRGSVGTFISSEKLSREKDTKSNYCINVKGNFCSANCVMRNIITHSKDLAEKIDKINMLLFVYCIFTNMKVADIQPSPLVSELHQYGGTLSEMEYQKKIDDMNIPYNTNEDSSFSQSCKTFLNSLN